MRPEPGAVFVRPFKRHQVKQGSTMFSVIEDDLEFAADTAVLEPGTPCPAPPSKKAGVTRCSTCVQQAFCMPPELNERDVARVSAIVGSTRTVRRGERLYRAGAAFESIYAVRAGCFKTVIVHRNGLEHVTGFYLAGDTLGLDGVSTDLHTCEAIALEDSIVCVIPFHLLAAVCRDVESMQHHVHRMLSSEIVREAGLLMQFGTMSAAQRIAAFLLDLSRRLKARGYSSIEFNLRMTREEIGSYLGMKLETVSRMFSRLQEDGLIDSAGKQVRILDIEGLQKL
jgi:CRP/FNR family transcriptional regulator, anaerobic regulatory protein